MSVKYRLEFTDELGREKKVEISQEGYSGSVTDLTGAGTSPLFISLSNQGDEKYDCVKGTEIEINVFAESDFQFEEISEGGDFEFKVEVYEDDNLKHAGYLVPEVYSEPYTVVPYPVSLRAVNLGLLKNIPYDGTGRATQMEVINKCLNELDLGLDIWDSANVYEDEMDTGLSPLVQAEVDQDSYKVDERGRERFVSCFDVLERNLKPYVVNLFQDGGVWKIIPIELRTQSRTVRVFDDGVFDSSFTHNPSDTTYQWVFQDQVLNPRPQLKEINSVYEHGLIPNLAKNGNFDTFVTDINNSYPEFWDLSDADDFAQAGLDSSIRRVAVPPDERGPFGVLFNGSLIGDGGFIEHEGDIAIEVEENDSVLFRIFYSARAYRRQLAGNVADPDVVVDMPTQIRIGDYYLKADGEWTLTPSDIVFSDLGNSNSGYIPNPLVFFGQSIASGFRSFEIVSQPIPEAGVLKVRIYKPTSEDEGPSLGDTFATVAYSFFEVDYYPDGFPQRTSKTFVGERDVDSFANPVDYDLFHGDGPTNIHPSAFTIDGSKTGSWTRGSLTGGISRLAMRTIANAYQSPFRTIQGSQRTTGAFDRYFTDKTKVFGVYSGSYDERLCYFNGEYLQGLTGDTPLTVTEFEEQQSSSISGSPTGGQIGNLDGRYFRIANDLSEGDPEQIRENIDVYSTGEVDEFVEDIQTDLVSLRLADESLMDRKAEAGLEIEAGDGLDGGGLLTDDLRFDVKVDNTTIEIDGDLQVKDLGISTGKLADDAVTTVKIADSNVTNAKLANSTISGKELGTNLDSLSAGDGLTGTAYNGSTARTFAVDPVAPIKITTGKVDLGFVAPLVLTGNDLDVQDASVSQRGVVSIGAQSFAGDKTFAGEVLYEKLHKANNFDLTTDFTGVGWRGSHEGDFNIRNLVVRDSARFRELIIDQLSAVGGSFLYSAARGKVESISGSVVTLEDPNDKGVSQFAVNDIFVVRIVDIDGGTFKLVTGRVSAVSNPGAGIVRPTITLAQDISDTSGSISDISVGDVIVQRGNTTNSARQNAIYVSATDSDSPSQKYFTGLNSIDAFNQEANIKVQSGNLANIANASGFGFYGENTFLTGELLVGDLTETDNFLKFDGSLTINADSITLSAIGDVGTATLDLQSDLVNLFLQEESTYAGVQFLAGQVIISASDVDGQGRAKLATVRLDATGDESVVGISADAFLLETNGLEINSDEFIQLGENFGSFGGILLSTAGTLFGATPNRTIYLQASDTTAGRPRRLLVKHDANNYFQYFTDNSGWNLTLEQSSVQVMRFDSTGVASIKSISGDLEFDLGDDVFSLSKDNNVFAELGEDGVVFNQGDGLYQGVRWKLGANEVSRITCPNETMQFWSLANSAAAGHQFTTKRGGLDSVAVQILRDKMIIGSDLDDADDYKLEFELEDDTDWTIGSIQEYMIVRFNGTKRAIPMYAATPDTPPPAVPSAPTSPTLCAESDPDVLRLKWTDSSGADLYNVYRSTTSGSGFSLVSTVGSGTVGYGDPIAPFFPTTTYYYRVTAVNDGGESAPSVEVFSSYDGALPC